MKNMSYVIENPSLDPHAVSVNFYSVSPTISGQGELVLERRTPLLRWLDKSSVRDDWNWMLPGIWMRETGQMLERLPGFQHCDLTGIPNLTRGSFFYISKAQCIRRLVQRYCRIYKLVLQEKQLAEIRRRFGRYSTSRALREQLHVPYGYDGFDDKGPRPGEGPTGYVDIVNGCCRVCAGPFKRRVYFYSTSAELAVVDERPNYLCSKFCNRVWLWCEDNPAFMKVNFRDPALAWLRAAIDKKKSTEKSIRSFKKPARRGVTA